MQHMHATYNYYISHIEIHTAYCIHLPKYMCKCTCFPQAHLALGFCIFFCSGNLN